MCQCNGSAVYNANIRWQHLLLKILYFISFLPNGPPVIIKLDAIQASEPTDKGLLWKSLMGTQIPGSNKKTLGKIPYAASLST